MLAVIVATAGLAIAGCGTSGGSKAYDISPIFPLSANKCSKYNGTASGTGIMAHCYVSKSECEKATADWKQSMQQGGVNDAIVFSCD